MAKKFCYNSYFRQFVQLSIIDILSVKYFLKMSSMFLLTLILKNKQQIHSINIKTFYQVLKKKFLHIIKIADGYLFFNE